MEELRWAVIRQDDHGNRYRVGRYATREEAERITARFAPRGGGDHYLIEPIDPRQAT
ncbi:MULTISPECIES: SPOR domain-containing protein [Streptomycetaceae]|uniref:SPOR domain-containing protein n=1 Tax=Streptantibioticus cattleyicolor (strain ATCC 35852 / DSM 46488 / JCM 4925 / NBRC 14057 / NRRL 8057) TaxID=1003195 RepID=F8K3J1_STREN|nr:MULTISPECIES: SPOR domain-containing protein [Streptomycetaceae]AEW96310.1 hypothetical protein SCATT_39390 [Streptantibioticus cattleyicolor NRRL 8057 = DSM 46488]MYS60825.1 SPOR domain-containing protein [Streptomyces sp. SID5468]CCB76649.1 conserved protein of unknown function [Streptantibioticus cattleyicolor NRRL 8057 = DSM 46488]